MKALEEKYKDDPQALAKESMKIMKTDGMGSLKGCLSIFVQLPVFIGLMYVVRSFAQGQISSDSIYSFLVPFAGQFTQLSSINHFFLGMDLFANHNIALTLIGCVFVFLQTKLTTMMQSNQPKPAMVAPGGQQMPDMTKMMGPMNLVMVFMMGTFIRSTQNGVGVYLVITTVFTVVQYAIQNREMIKIKWITRDVKIVNSK